MFTGIVEEMGDVISITGSRDSKIITVKANVVLEGSMIGDSISINGVCQTIKTIGPNFFSADVLKESLTKSNLGNLSQGKKVNLERALTLSKPLGGHILQGHIQGTARVISIKRLGVNTFLTLKLPINQMLYMVKEGSIAVDGLSLTIAQLGRDTVGINIIPHTLETTTIGFYKVGDIVNIEPDILMKGVIKNKSSSLTKEKLLSWGY